jgi:hypothetical protein
VKSSTAGIGDQYMAENFALQQSQISGDVVAHFLLLQDPGLQFAIVAVDGAQGEKFRLLNRKEDADQPEGEQHLPGNRLLAEFVHMRAGFTLANHCSQEAASTKPPGETRAVGVEHEGGHVMRGPSITEIYKIPTELT